MNCAFVNTLARPTSEICLNFQHAGYAASRTSGSPRRPADQTLARFFVSLFATFRAAFLAPPTTRLRGLGAGFLAPLRAFLALERPLEGDLDVRPAAFLAVFVGEPPLRLAAPGFPDALPSTAPIACKIR